MSKKLDFYDRYIKVDTSLEVCTFKGLFSLYRYVFSKTGMRFHVKCISPEELAKLTSETEFLKRFSLMRSPREEAMKNYLCNIIFSNRVLRLKMYLDDREFFKAHFFSYFTQKEEFNPDYGFAKDFSTLFYELIRTDNPIEEWELATISKELYYGFTFTEVVMFYFEILFEIALGYPRQFFFGKAASADFIVSAYNTFFIRYLSFYSEGNFPYGILSKEDLNILFNGNRLQVGNLRRELLLLRTPQLKKVPFFIIGSYSKALHVLRFNYKRSMDHRIKDLFVTDVLGNFRLFRKSFFIFLENSLCCCYIRQTKSNIFVTLTHFFDGSVFFSNTSSRLKSSRTKKESLAPSNALLLGSLTGFFLRERSSYRNIFVRFNHGFNSASSRNVIRGMAEQGAVFKYFLYGLGKGHNGCRPKKKRRL